MSAAETSPQRQTSHSEPLEEALRRVFGYQWFRPHQRELVEALLAGSDVFATMPTGGGKSLCYQLAGYRLDGVTVVVSPLIALMHDQVENAKQYGMRAELLNSSLTGEERRSVFRKLHRGQVDLLYISPERFASPDFRLRLADFDPPLFVIDEAHCISEWGHEFRPDYLSLRHIRRDFPGSGIAAFTATATPEVQRDILSKLGMRDPYLVRASFDRPELFYRVERKGDVLEQILEFVRERPGVPGIVYRTRRAAVEETSAYLASHGVRALHYHAGLEDARRKEHQERFVRDEVDVIVATIAFGMGIDKSNVRFVIHGDLPKSLEAYYQETGRAGRDGLLSHCLLLYSSQDIRTLRYFIEQSEDMEERRRGERNLKTILRYAESEQCRRSVLLGHFGEEYSGNCNHCDICTDAARVEDCTLDAQKLLSAVARTGESFGAGHIVDIVKGADTRRIRERGHHTLPTYGVGSEKAKEYWRELLEELQRRELLRPEGERYPVLQMTPGGRDVLFGRSPFQRTLRRRRTELLKKGNAGKGGGRAAHSRSATASAAGAGERSESGAQHLREELFQRLRDWRRQEAQRRRIAPYMVFSDATLRQLAADQPLSREELLRVEGVGRAKMKRYGRSLIELIAAFQVERQG